MNRISESGLNFPNKFALATLRALEDVVGKNGLNTILNLANLEHFVDNLPPNNLNQEFNFSYYSAISLALEEMYGPRGGRGLALRAGRATFSDFLRNFGAFAGARDLAFKILPVHIKIKIGLLAMARNFTQISDQHSTVHETEDEYIYTVHQCSVCWGRSEEEKPVCFVITGLLQEGLNWFSGGKEFRVNESKCVAKGDEVCEFIIQKQHM